MHTFIHGHKCNHELISDVDYSLEAYDMLLNSSFSLTLAWAVHPFSKHYSILDYNTVCEEFNRDIEWVIHPWMDYSVPQLWEVCRRFNWSAHVAAVGTSDILHPDYVYTKWYENIFKQHYSYDEWLALKHTV